MSRRHRGRVIHLLLCLGLLGQGAAKAQTSSPGALARYDLAADPGQRIRLPGDLSEVSGIAFTRDDRLLAHGDERAVVWELQWPSGRVVKRFGIGGRNGPAIDDFEDIEVVGERVYLVSSTGQVIEGREGADGETTPVVRATRGLKAGCEVEGMTWDPASGSMLLLCKAIESRKWKDHVVVLAVAVETGQFEPEPRIAVPESDLRRVTGQKRFAGTALVRHPRTGTYLLLAGPQRAIAEIDSTGAVLGGARLPAARHRQPEGIAIASDLTLLISDEGAGHAATISGYAYRR